MKVKKTFVREYQGWPGISVAYTAEYGDGKVHNFTCSKDEWMVEQLTEKLVDAGADEKVLEELKDFVSEIARENEWMSTMGEEL